jgi:hypothetical protein
LAVAHPVTADVAPSIGVTVVEEGRFEIPHSQSLQELRIQSQSAQVERPLLDVQIIQMEMMEKIQYLPRLLRSEDMAQTLTQQLAVQVEIQTSVEQQLQLMVHMRQAAAAVQAA